ncbi:MAG TPA: TIGR01777 family oxidoreductase [Bryobacteraceae bacterium]|nr:TIGR01777 family oxidoreductase [Bryobacteraceae bacterium]
MNLTLTGASGFIGRRLMKLLVSNGHNLHVLSRHAGTNLPPNVRLSVWDALSGPPPEAALRDADAVIHLAGEQVGQRWTPESKRRIRESRVQGTRNLVEAMSKLPGRPRAFICASAIGYYGSRGDEILTEASTPGSGFLPEVCLAWEREAGVAEQFGARVVRLRIGVVLGRHGGALARMLPPFRLGAGGRLASGRQWMSWIHLDDLCEVFRFAVEQPVRGAMNGVAPDPVTNAEFTRALASALHRPAIFPVPAFALRALFGEMSEVLLSSQRVSPKGAEQGGFRFRYPQLGAALADLLSK